MGSRLEAKSTEVRKRIERHTFADEAGDEYKGSKFGGFPEYFRRKKIKLQNLDAELRSHSADKPQIFRGVVAHVNGYTQPSLNDLHAMVVAHGGGFLQYLDGKTMVTHIVASNLTPKKVVEFRRYRIVKPAWIVDSVKAGKLLPWDAYRVVDEGLGQKVLNVENGTVQSHVNQKPTGYRDQTDNSWYTTQLEKANPGLGSQDVAEEFIEPELEENDEAAESDALDEDEDEEEEHGLERNNEAAELHNFRENDEEQRPSEASHDSPESNTVEQLERSTLAKITKEPSLDDVFYYDEDTGRYELRVRAGAAYQPKLDEALRKRLSDPPTEDSPAKKTKLTAEEHNTVLLSDPRIRKSSVLNPDFLEQYYRESRLHHLSTWKAELKSQLQAMTAEKSSQQKRTSRPPGARRYILHVDFDSFFVAVSMKTQPQYLDKPAVVAHGSGSGSEIASCNYPARKFGVKNGMWMKRALEMCPELKVLAYDFPGYEAASKQFYDAIIATGGLIQSVSIDEALIDATDLCLSAGGTNGTSVREGSIWREQAKAEEIGQNIRNHVKEQTGCAVSVGIGGNILLAKVALRKAKPAGQHQIKPDEVLDFLADLPVQDLPGVAYSLASKLEELGVKLVKDIRDLTKERLMTVMGPKTGDKLYNYARGIDRSEVGDQVVRKSVSAEVNWGVRFETDPQVDEFIENLCGELSRRLIKEGVRGRQLAMKVMRRAADAPLDPPKHLGHGKCDSYNKSIVLGVATNAKEVLTKEALSILRGFGFSPGELRGLGVQMTKLEPLKANGAGHIDGSQKRLQFKIGSTTKSSGQPTEAAVVDTIQDYPETPKKPKSSQFGAGLHQYTSKDTNSPSRKPLNTLGTQFILPSQVDPEVLKQLPADIQARLTRIADSKRSISQGKSIDELPEEQKPNQAVRDSIAAFPNQSQLDPEILKALPADVRAEVLAQYEISPSKPRPGQAILPQSPRKIRTVDASRRGVSGRGRPRGGNTLLSRLKSGASKAVAHTLTQSNFVNIARDTPEPSDSEGAELTKPELSTEFLAALPEDIRQEVIETHKREQLRRTAGLEVSRRRPRPVIKRQEAGEAFQQDGERILKMDARPVRPLFTVQGLWRVEDLREAIGEWFEEFSKEGPYREDVAALTRYLASVVLEECDIDKAVNVVKWIQWVVDQARADESRSKWDGALNKARETVNQALGTRGLAHVEFE